jgi:hypothetical protein
VSQPAAYCRVKEPECADTEKGEKDCLEEFEYCNVPDETIGSALGLAHCWMKKPATLEKIAPLIFHLRLGTILGRLT